MSRTTDPDKESDKGSAAAPDSESALRRWSRRKHESRLAAKRTAAVPDPQPTARAEPNPAAASPVLTDADMPPIETLDEHSDYSPFMSPGVSDALRQSALRRLFRSPQLNQLCELEGEFFDARGFEPLGNVVTHEMRAALERELEKVGSGAKEKIRASINGSEKTAAVGGAGTAERDPAGQADAAPQNTRPKDGAETDRNDA